MGKMMNRVIRLYIRLIIFTEIDVVIKINEIDDEQVALCSINIIIECDVQLLKL